MARRIAQTALMSIGHRKMRRTRLRGLAVAGCLLAPVAVSAQSDLSSPGLSVSGQFDFGLRSYLDDGRYAGQSDAGAQVFFGTTVNATMPLGTGQVVLQFSASADTDGARDAFNLQRAYYTRSFGDWDLLAGMNVDTWGVAESRSVMNVLNPQDGTDVIYGGDFVGTPMINASYYSDFGTFSAYALTGFVEPVSPGASSRLRAPFPVADGQAVYQEGDGRHLDFAFRWRNNFALGDGALDVAASYFNGTSRTPVGLLGCAPTGGVTDATCDAVNAAVVDAFRSGDPAVSSVRDLFDQLADLPEDVVEQAVQQVSAIPGLGIVPYYQHIQQGGLSAVYARGDLQVRTELAFTKPDNMDGYWSGVVGGDYTFHGIGPADASLTLVAEYLWDDRSMRAPSVLFGNDLFLGLNLFLNDSRDTAIRLGGFHDLDSDAQLFQLSASTRLNDAVRLDLTALHVRADGWSDPLSFVDRDSFVELKISTYF